MAPQTPLQHRLRKRPHPWRPGRDFQPHVLLCDGFAFRENQKDVRCGARFFHQDGSEAGRHGLQRLTAFAVLSTRRLFAIWSRFGRTALVPRSRRRFARRGHAAQRAVIRPNAPKHQQKNHAHQLGETEAGTAHRDKIHPTGVPFNEVPAAPNLAWESQALAWSTPTLIDLPRPISLWPAEATRRSARRGDRMFGAPILTKRAPAVEEAPLSHEPPPPTVSV